MKSYLAIASVLISGSLAVPAVPEKVQWMNLQTKSNVNTFNGLYLSSQNGKVGLFAGDKTNPQKAGRFFTTPYEEAGTLSLHIDDDSRQVALVGENGLFEMVDVENPSAQDIPPGKAMEWSTFQFDGRNNLNVEDGQEIPERTWVSYANTDGSYGIALYDGITVPQPRALQNITIVAVKAS